MCPFLLMFCHSCLLADAGAGDGPVEVAQVFFKHVGAGEFDAALKHVVEHPGKAELAKSFKAPFGFDWRVYKNSRYLGSKQLDDVAIVIVGIEAPSFPQGIDIDPVCLTRTAGKWMVATSAPMFDEPKGDHPEAVELRKKMRSLIEWYNLREKELYAERANRKN